MKFIGIAYALALAAAGSFVAASPSLHRHGHRHVEKRGSPNVKVVVKNEYEINNKQASLKEVCAGLKAGFLRTSDGSNTLSDCDGIETAEKPSDDENRYDSAERETVTPTQAVIVVSTSAPKSSVVPKPSVVPSVKENNVISSSSSATPIASSVTEKSSAPSASSDVSYTSSAPSASSDVSYTSSDSGSDESDDDSDDSNGGKGLDREFPNKEIDCSEFPSDYGPIPIPWIKIGGWSGIQYVTIDNGAVTEIHTAVEGGKGCIPGAMCSYACPPGYQKTQWPAAQGLKGESVGGLLCNDNKKLELTNPDLSKKLCMKGTGATQVENKLSQNCAICRTDYPGTENESVPLNTLPGTTSELTCPDSKEYFVHRDGPTTAQYYVNNKGVPKEDGCRWNEDGSHKGNWAPTYFGVGRDVYGKTFLSIASTIQNEPKDYKPLDFTVTLTGNLSGKCRVQNGKYCSGDNYDICNEMGCTVELYSGKATYVLTDS